MQRSLGLKLVAVGAIIAVLLIALSFIASLVGERQARRDGVVRDIASSSSLAQQFTGPIILVPYEKTVCQTKEDPTSQKTYVEEREVSGQLLFLPETFSLNGDMRTARRARGIYEARLYHASLKITSRFDLPAHYGIESDLGAYHFAQPTLIMGISDIRGIGPIPVSRASISPRITKFPPTALPPIGPPLTVVMVLTRRVDWFSLGRQGPSA